MKLDKKERLSLVNQFLILEKLYPDEAQYYAEQRQALSEGYELHYQWIFEDMWDDLPEDECRKVLDIMTMYSAIQMVVGRTENDELKNHFWAKFRGFDGNHETRYMSYTRYFILTLGRFDELRYGEEAPDFNNHMPSLPRYETMLERWKLYDNRYELNEGQVWELLDK